MPKYYPNLIDFDADASDYDENYEMDKTCYISEYNKQIRKVDRSFK